MIHIDLIMSGFSKGLVQIIRVVNDIAYHAQCRVRDMVFNDTFNNISVISWRSVLLVEETGVPRENNRPVASH